MSTGFLYELSEGMATITFDRASTLNAFTRDMALDLVDLLNCAERDDAVNVIIITGSGRVFCAGADLSGGSLVPEVQSADSGGCQTDLAGESIRDFGGFITLRLFECLKPVIVAFNGSAAGMGVTMALAADFRLAVKGSKFVLPFVRRGIVPESASAWFLPRIVGVAAALDWMLTGRQVPAEEALAAGLLRSLHEPSDLLPAARVLASDIVANTAPVSVALTRQLLWRMLGADHPMEAHKIESRAAYVRARSDDAKEGVASFLEKRLPSFSGRVSRDMPEFFPWWPERRYE